MFAVSSVAFVFLAASTRLISAAVAVTIFEFWPVGFALTGRERKQTAGGRGSGGAAAGQQSNVMCSEFSASMSAALRND